jgi:antirestriction protein ArdC
MGKQDERTERYVAEVTGSLVRMMEEGLADPEAWIAPWDHVKASDLAPWNPATDKPYTGGNRWNLFLVARLAGVPGHWATFKQWQSIGASVRKGEASFARALRPLQSKWEDQDTGEKHVRTIGFGSYAVFNASQVDDYEMPRPMEPTVHTVDAQDDIAAAYTWAATIGVRVNESQTEGAYYSPTFDAVTVPERGRWHSADGAWSTIAHECTHWTGHESRLARTFGRRFGDDAYAIEELCAELGAATILAMRGRSKAPRPDHAHYLAHWLRVLKAKPSALFSAAAAAEKAASYLDGRAIEVGQVAA